MWRASMNSTESLRSVPCFPRSRNHSVTLPVTLWFLDRGKKATDRSDSVLFIDARKIFRQIDRAHRDWLPEHIEFLANIVRLYRGEPVEASHGSGDLMRSAFPDGTYADVPGLCGAASLADVEDQGWSLNPGRYVGVGPNEDDGVNFHERFAELCAELIVLNASALEIQERIARNAQVLLVGRNG